MNNEQDIELDYEIPPHKASNNQVWYDYGNEYRLKERSKKYERLENCVYSIHQDLFGFYLVKESEKFVFDYKLYGLEDKLIKRVLRTYANKNHGNLGVLLKIGRASCRERV